MTPFTELLESLTADQLYQLEAVITEAKRAMWRDLLDGGDGMEGDRVLSRLIDEIGDRLDHLSGAIA